MLLPGESVDQAISAELFVSSCTTGPFVMRSALGLACDQDIAESRSNDEKKLAWPTSS